MEAGLKKVAEFYAFSRAKASLEGGILRRTGGEGERSRARTGRMSASPQKLCSRTCAVFARAPALTSHAHLRWLRSRTCAGFVCAASAARNCEPSCLSCTSCSSYTSCTSCSSCQRCTCSRTIPPEIVRGATRPTVPVAACRFRDSWLLVRKSAFFFFAGGFGLLFEKKGSVPCRLFSLENGFSFGV